MGTRDRERRARLGRRSLRRFVLPFAIGLVVSVVLLSAAASYRNTESLFENVRAVRHTHVVLERIETLVSMVREAEAGQRGYIITGDRSYLDSYRRSREHVGPQLEELARLVSDNPSQEARRASLAALIAERFTRLEETILAFEAEGLAEAQARIRGGAGKAHMDSIRSLATEMEDVERALATERGNAMTLAYRAALATPIVSILLGLGVVALAFYLLQRDVTRRSRAARAVRESEERYRSLVAATTAIVGVADGEGQFTVPQPSWEAYTGQPWAEHAGYGYIDALHPEDREAAALAWTRAREGRVLFQYEARLRHGASGSYRYCQARVVPVFNDDHSVREWVSSIIDVDARRRAEAEREELLAAAERARQEAVNANEAKDSFLATLSHELRSPLQGAMGWVSLLRSGRLSPEQHAKAVSTLERGIRHQSQLVNDLLDVSRIISGKLSLEASIVDLGLVLEQVREEFLLAAQTKGVELTSAVSGDCGAVLGDVERLAQIFRNLVANAIKFTDAGGSVRISAETENRMAVVTVSDTGQGIPAEFLPRIFDRFSQADSSTTRQHGGLGLGLGIVRHLVEMHGGSVSAESAGPGRGASFRIRLPLVRQNVERGARASGIAELDAGKGDLRRVRVCVVDDDRDTLDAVVMMLEQAGAVVTPSNGAREALEVLPASEPDVIVTDLSMPGEDGFWLAQQVRAAGFGVPIVALTGLASSDMRARVLSGGFQAHVAKPVEVHLLVTTIRDLLGRSAQA